jgi:hypothetical protein
MTEIFDDDTVETASRSSIEWWYGIIIIRDNQQIINFDDDSLGKPR